MRHRNMHIYIRDMCCSHCGGMEAFEKKDNQEETKKRERKKMEGEERRKQSERLQVTRQVCSAYLTRNSASYGRLQNVLNSVQCELLYMT